LGDPPKIKSVRGILYDRKTLIKVLMSFYKDREEERRRKRRHRRRCRCKERREGMCLCLRT
jgi:hypothetical protein